MPAIEGINVIGPGAAAGDAGHVLRATVAALRVAGVAVAETSAPWDDLPHPVSLFVEDPAVLAPLLEARAGALRDRHNALLAWCELPVLPRTWLPVCARMQTILTPNAFAAVTFRSSFGDGVRTIPFVPVLDGIAEVRPAAFTFVATLDPAASLERQNVNGLLSAFVHAFAGRRDVELTVIVDGAFTAESVQPYDAISASYPNVRFVGGVLGAAAAFARIRDADAFVALERVEGLGLHALAAMSLGRPVVGTEFGALGDLLDESVGEPVRYQLIPADGSESTWADPLVDAAAAALRRLVEHPARTRALGAAARERIERRRADFSSGAWLAPLEARVARDAVPDPQPVAAPVFARTSAPRDRRVSVLVEGEFRSPLSLARINRELGLLLARDPGIEFIGVDHAGAPDPRIELAPELAACMRPAAVSANLRPDVRCTLHWPPLLDRRPAHRYVAILPWELSELPITWRDAIRRGIDEVWVLSRHSHGAFTRAGIDPGKLVVLSLGIDPEFFRPDGPRLDLAARAFRFLYLGGTVGRKGFDFVERAYFRTFGAADDFTLVVKDVGTDTVYKDDNAATYLRRMSANPNVAHLLYLNETLDDDQLARLYRSCDVLLAPYRAEGFGLPILEAMACGLPVIVPAGGASDDFVDETCGIRIPAPRVPVRHDVGIELVRDAWVLEPDLAALEQAMLTLAGGAELRRQLGAAAAARAATWTWERTAAIARAAIERLAGVAATS